MAEPVQLYICFAEENENALSRLEKQLTALIKTDKIQLWHRDKLKGGDDTDQHIATYLDQAQIILILVSADLFGAYYNSNEVQHAFQRHKEQKVRLIPVIVDFCNWQVDPILSTLTPLPRRDKPAQDAKGWSIVVKEINLIVTKMQSEQAQKEPAPLKAPRPRTRSHKLVGAKPQQLSGAALTTNTPTTTRPRRSTSLPAPSQPALPEQTLLPSIEEPEPMSTEASATTPTFTQDYDQIRDDMLKIVFSILIWEPSRSTHDLIASERRAIHQALLDQQHRTVLGSTLPVPEGVSLQDCEITRANMSDMTFVIVEPEIPSMLEWQAFYHLTDEKFINKTYCYYPENVHFSGQLDKDLHSFKKLDYYQETEISGCHIRTEVLNWVQTKRTFIYRSGQRSRRGR